LSTANGDELTARLRELIEADEATRRLGPAVDARHLGQLRALAGEVAVAARRLSKGTSLDAEPRCRSRRVARWLNEMDSRWDEFHRFYHPVRHRRSDTMTAKIYREMCRCSHEKTSHDILPETEVLLGRERALIQGAGRCLVEGCDCERWTFKTFLDRDGQPTTIENAEVLREL
jgi:hypothetical protein